MKQYKYIAAAAVLALSMGFTACDDDDDLIFPEVPETPTGAVKAVGASVESGAVISADVTEISIAYDASSRSTPPCTSPSTAPLPMPLYGRKPL